MLKLENWGDLFKFNKELLEDDYNHGQQIVIKCKAKAEDGVTVRILRCLPLAYHFCHFRKPQPHSNKLTPILLENQRSHLSLSSRAPLATGLMTLLLSKMDLLLMTANTLLR